MKRLHISARCRRSPDPLSRAVLIRVAFISATHIAPRRTHTKCIQAVLTKPMECASSLKFFMNMWRFILITSSLRQPNVHFETDFTHPSVTSGDSFLPPAIFTTRWESVSFCAIKSLRISAIKLISYSTNAWHIRINSILIYLKLN